MKISKATRATITEHATAANAAKDALVSAIEEYNARLDDLHGTIEAAKDELQGEFDEKSERWQEGDKGQAVSAWLDDIGSKADEIADGIDVEVADIDAVIDFPDEPEDA
jgi:uncharacterized protein YukE